MAAAGNGLCPASAREAAAGFAAELASAIAGPGMAFADDLQAACL